MKEEFSFSFAVIPDIEFTRPTLDLADLLRGRKEGVVGKEAENRLVATVNFINTIPEIDFAATAGDLTDSALLEQFLMVKEVLDKLNVPWLPEIGNHDLWSYRKLPDPILSRKHSWEDESPNGLRIFEEVFQENFRQLSEFFDGWRKQKASFLNYTFLHKGVRFIVIDNMSRRHAILGFPGVIGFPHLYPETKDWLREQLSQKEEIKIVISHAPLSRKLLKAFSNKSKKIVHIAGHVHKESLRKSDKIIIFTTGALYLKPVVNIVKVLPDDIQFHSVRIP